MKSTAQHTRATRARPSPLTRGEGRSCGDALWRASSSPSCPPRCAVAGGPRWSGETSAASRLDWRPKKRSSLACLSIPRCRFLRRDSSSSTVSTLGFTDACAPPRPPPDRCAPAKPPQARRAHPCTPRAGSVGASTATPRCSEGAGPAPGTADKANTRRPGRVPGERAATRRVSGGLDSRRARLPAEVRAGPGSRSLRAAAMVVPQRMA